MDLLAKFPRLFFSVTAKITVACFVIIVLVAAIVSNFLFEETKVVVSADKERDLVRIAEAQEQILLQEFETTQRTVRSVATDPVVTEFLEASEPSLYAKTLAHLQAYNASQLYESLYVLDHSGLTVVATNPTFEGNNYGFRDYFTQARSDKVFISTALGITTNKMGYYFSYPIYSNKEKGKFLGVAVIKMGEENINKVYFDPSDWDTHLVDSDGVFVFSTKDNLILKSLIVTPGLNELIGKKESRYLGMEIVSLGRENEWSRIRTSSESLLFHAQDLTGYGLQSIFVSKRIGETDYYLILSATENTILSLATNLARSTALQIMLAAFVALIIITIVIYWILLPIKEIKLFAESISSGDYTSSLELKSYDEFQEVANALDEMKKKVGSDFAKLSKNVDETQIISRKKVEELEKLNNLMVNREIELIKLKSQLKARESNQGK
ncbi:hypothetical protein KA017_00365 [Candidatus Woesebacteria bacterium]|nr:hypothetical protein [Candidatus Woesebacteria bacterium]